MAKYMILSEEGTMVAFYDDVINKDIPTNALKISDDIYSLYFNSNFYKTIYKEGVWCEGLSQEEIDDLNNQPKELTEIEKLKISQAEQFELIIELLGGM